MLRDQEDGGATAEVCRRHGISEQTFYRWKAKCSGIAVSDAQKLKTLEDENRRLKKMYMDEKLKAEVVAEAIAKKW